jgi:hypothetical protein
MPFIGLLSSRGLEMLRLGATPCRIGLNGRFGSSPVIFGILNFRPGIFPRMNSEGPNNSARTVLYMHENEQFQS